MSLNREYDPARFSKFPRKCRGTRDPRTLPIWRIARLHPSDVAQSGLYAGMISLFFISNLSFTFEVSICVPRVKTSNDRRDQSYEPTVVPTYPSSLVVPGRLDYRSSRVRFAFTSARQNGKQAKLPLLPISLRRARIKRARVYRIA